MIGVTRREDRDSVRKSLYKDHIIVRLSGLRIRFEKRSAGVYILLCIGILATALVGILIGDYGISVAQVFASIAGVAEDALAQYFVTEVRLPRAVCALLVGAALGTSGAIFQTVSGNPLGSPDIIGFTKGAATGALVAIVVFNGSSASIALGAIAGGLLTAALVYGLSWRQGVAGFRLVLVGIGIGAVLSAINSLLVVKASLASAQTASQWLAGSLNAALWPEVVLVGAALALLLPAAWSQFRALSCLPLGDSLATALGVRVERSRLILIIIGVALMAVATAATGPISFVALAAPHLVRKITRTPGTALVGSALMGALLVLVADIIARRIFAPDELAVGIITGSLGGIYLIILLAMEWRKRK